MVSIVLLWVKPQCLDLTPLSLNRIQRFQEGRDDNIHCFSTHFYSQLVQYGYDRVKSWTAKKQINIFWKKMLFIPICEEAHWSLCVVVNPGAILKHVSPDSPLTCMLHFDSLKAHDSQKVREHVVHWLNSEWGRIRGLPSTVRPFDCPYFPVYKPTSKFASFNHLLRVFCYT